MDFVKMEYSGGGVEQVTGLTFNQSINYPANSTIYKDDTYVYGCIMGVATTDLPVNSVIVSGLPKPATGLSSMRMPIIISSNDSTQLPKSGIAELDSNGNVVVTVATANATNHYITINFMYKYA